MYKFSIIVPVYNAASYLIRCLDSIKSQNYQGKIQVICVNDGSLDASEKILEEYSWDERFDYIFINKENEGPSVARNLGMDRAKGDIIVFLDSDDYLSFNALTVLEKEFLKELDFVSYSGVNVDIHGCIYSNPYWEFLYLPRQVISESFLKNESWDFFKKMAVSTCLTAYRREFLKANNINFPANLLFEDNYFFSKAFLCCSRFGIVREKIYYRQIHSSSITQNIRKNTKDRVRTYGLVIELLENMGAPRSVIKGFREVYVNSLISLYRKLPPIFIIRDYFELKPFFGEVDWGKRRLNKELIKKIFGLQKVREENQTSLKIAGFSIITKIKSYPFYRFKIFGFLIPFKKLEEKFVRDLIVQIELNKKALISSRQDCLTALKKNESGLEEIRGKLDLILNLKEKNNIEAAKVVDLLNKNLGKLNEIFSSQLVSSSTKNCDWFSEIALSPGRWAIGYSAIYILFKILELSQPSKILELGMGQSTKIIAAYCKARKNCKHIVVENDKSWIDFFQRQFNPSSTTDIVVVETEKVFVEEGEYVTKFKELREKVGVDQFDLIFIDAPIGGDQRYSSRIDILELIPDFLAKDFVLFFDDSNRRGEINTIKKVEDLLRKRNIPFKTGTFYGEKNSTIIVSKANSFLVSV